MTYTVELRYIGGDLADPTGAMQAWFEQNRIEPEDCLHSSGPPGLAFRVGFGDRDQATRFAAAFGGWLECADPKGMGRRWIAPRARGVDPGQRARDLPRSN